MIKSKIMGLPGTGKTTQLIKSIEDLINTGLIHNLSDTCICTFRKEMAFDIVEKLRNKFSIEKGDLEHTGTIHGISKRLLNILKHEVVETKDLKEFMFNSGLEYSEHDPDLIDPTDSGKHKKGNILMDAYKWVNEIKTEKTDLSEYPNLHRLNDVIEIETFIEEYDHFKQEKGIYDFTDMLRGVIDNNISPGTKVLIVDEFQDLSPIQIKIFNQWTACAEYVFIAGDPYQSIYPFWGATPDYFNDYVAKTEILPTSRRFGASIWEFSKGILETAGYSDIPQIEATGTSSEVKQIDAGDYMNAIPNFTSNTFHLVRCNYMAYSIAKELINAGILFKGNYGWSDNQLTVLNAIITFRNTGYLNKKGLIELIKIHPESHFKNRTDELQTSISNSLKSDYTKQDIKKIVSPLSIHAGDNFINSISKEPYLEYSDLTDFNKSKFRGVLEKRKEPQNTITVSLGTVHSAKGREADNVFIWNETNRKINLSCSNEDQLKDEARVWFVGTTRTRNNLYWVESGKKYSWGL